MKTKEELENELFELMDLQEKYDAMGKDIDKLEVMIQEKLKELRDLIKSQ